MSISPSDISTGPACNAPMTFQYFLDLSDIILLGYPGLLAIGLSHSKIESLWVEAQAISGFPLSLRPNAPLDI